MDRVLLEQFFNKLDYISLVKVLHILEEVKNLNAEEFKFICSVFDDDFFKKVYKKGELQ